MKDLLYQLPASTPFVALVFALAIAPAFAVRKFLKNPIHKAKDNKALLKELLEGFELEIPSELEESEFKGVKSLKGQ